MMDKRWEEEIVVVVVEVEKRRDFFYEAIWKYVGEIRLRIASFPDERRGLVLLEKDLIG